MTETGSASSKGGASAAKEPKDSKAVVVDLGRYSRKRIKSARRGEGPVLDDVQEALAELKSDGIIKEQAEAVVVIVREKRNSRRKKAKNLPSFLKF